LTKFAELQRQIDSLTADKVALKKEIEAKNADRQELERKM
jgi:hypothetical protein